MWKRIPSIGLIVLSTILIGLAQPATPSGPADAGAKTAAIWITARNRDGTPAELSASDMELRLDGKQVPVGDVRRMSPPLRYCLMFDISGSARVRLRQQQDEAIALLSKIPQPGRDYGALVAFNDEAHLDAQGNDPHKLMQAISKESPRSSTALYDAIIACSDALANAAHESELRLMFIFSDGEDNSSRSNLNRTLDIVAHAGIRVYSIGRTEGPRAAHALKEFAGNSGGKNYFPKNQQDLEKSLTDILEDLTNVYSVTVPDPLPGDRVYKVDLKCLKKNVSLTAPRQYFTPLQQ